MSIVYNNGVALSTRGVAFLSSGDPNQATAEKPKLDELNAVDPWARWGENNLLPVEMTKDIEACGVLMAAIDGKARFGLGRGVKPFNLIEIKPNGEEVLEPANNPEIDDWMEETNMFHQSFGFFKDVIGFANFHLRFKFDRAGKKIGLLIRDDVTEMRYKRRDENGRITSTYLCADWSKKPNKTDKSLVEVELLPDIGTANYLTSKDPSQRRNKEYAMTGRVPGWNRHYYSQPTWYAAKKWVDIAKNVPSMKAMLFENNIQIKYVVEISDAYWTRVFGDEWNGYNKDERDEKRQEVFTSIDNFLVGTKNAYKAVFVPANYDPVTGKNSPDIVIKAIEDTAKQGELLPDSAAANSEILFALMMNPALMGADMPGGPYSGGAGSGSNIREAALVQVMIQEFERQQLSRALNIVKKVNGWPEDIVWRFPGLVLTTLDKGKSTEPVNTGG